MGYWTEERINSLIASLASGTAGMAEAAGDKEAAAAYDAIAAEARRGERAAWEASEAAKQREIEALVRQRARAYWGRLTEGDE